jgi:hypothetical protein
MGKIFAFDGTEWMPVKRVMVYNDIVGFLPARSVNVHSGTNWVSVVLEDENIVLTTIDALVGV